MKPRILSILAVFILLSGLSSFSWASGQKGVRSCLSSDLIGTWELRSMNTKIKIDPNDPFGWPFQRFSFDHRGDVKEMMSTTPIEGNKAAIQKFENAASTSKFSLDEKGILSVSKIESPLPERCACTVATKDVPAEMLAKLPSSKRTQVPHQGDLVLTYMNRSGQPVIIKSLRKL